MMKLSLMQRVVDTVDESWQSPLAEQILQPWGYDPGTVRFVRASANFIFVTQRAGKRYFLRFNDVHERSRRLLLAETNLLTWLAAQGIRLAEPVRSVNGAYVESMQTEYGSFHAVLFEGLSGGHREAEEMAPADFRTWGSALGQLHAALQRYTDPSAADRESWRDHLALAREYIAPTDSVLQTEWERLAAWAERLPTGPADYGLIHYDFETDNLCWSDGAVAALDFDDCCHHWYVADIAYALGDLFAGGMTTADPRFAAFMDGYTTWVPVNAELLAQIPLFRRLHDLYTYGRVSRALDLAQGPLLPPWLDGLNNKLRGRLESYRATVAATQV